MPPQYRPRQAPAFNQSVATQAAAGGFSSYRLFRPEFDREVEFLKPAYDKQKKPVTVFRPYPCLSFEHPDSAFMPYRMDPGGQNYFGFWLKRVWVAWNVGRPSTTFIISGRPGDPPFDSRATPLGTICRAVGGAIKRGQGKAATWQRALSKSGYEPNAKTLLEWDGMRDGETGMGASLTMPRELYLMQGMVPMLGGDVMWGRQDKLLPGWGAAKTCVFGLSSGAGETLLDHLNAENPDFRGDPADFERRYRNGDPVSVDSGRFIYIYPKGGDPRQQRLQSQPSHFDPLQASSAAVGQDGRPKEEIGYDLHLEATFQGRPAALNQSEDVKRMIRTKWRHWDDADDGSAPGLLYYPDPTEQAAILGGILPADMLVYAFEGERPEWLSDEIRRRAVAAVSGSVPPPAPPQGYGQPNPTYPPYPSAGQPNQPYSQPPLPTLPPPATPGPVPTDAAGLAGTWLPSLPPGVADPLTASLSAAPPPPPPAAEAPPAYPPPQPAPAAYQHPPTAYQPPYPPQVAQQAPTAYQPAPGPIPGVPDQALAQPSPAAAAAAHAASLGAQPLALDQAIAGSAQAATLAANAPAGHASYAGAFDPPPAQPAQPSQQPPQGVALTPAQVAAMRSRQAAQAAAAQSSGS